MASIVARAAAASSTMNRCCSRTTNSILQRSYQSRAHPKPRPVFSIHNALDQVLEGITERKDKREVNWIRRAEQRNKKGIKDNGPYRNQDETVEFALNLNVDPRKPGQNLRSSVRLPHGTGKIVKVIVFTADPAVAEQALKDGAAFAGGEELVDSIVNASLSLDAFDRAVASQDIMPYLSKHVARILGPRGIMPNAKVGTLVKNAADLSDVVQTQLAGAAQFRTDRAGIIHIGIGKGAFGKDKLLENAKAVIRELYSNKPEAYGKGKKKPSKTAQYVLKGHMTATQGKGSVRVDLRTIDPSSTYFMAELEE